MPTFTPGQSAASYLAALNALANNGSMAVIDAPQTYTAMPTFGAGIGIPTGQSITGAGTAEIGGFASVSATTIAGTLSTAAQNSVTTMTGLTTVGALNAGSITSGFGSIDIGADAITAGAISGTTGAFGAALASLVSPLTVSSASNVGLSLRRNTNLDRLNLFVGTTSGAFVTDEAYIQAYNTGLHILSGAAGTTEVALFSPTGLAVTGTLSTTGALTTNGGLQTFGANDSAGAGYRLVKVPNI